MILRLNLGYTLILVPLSLFHVALSSYCGQSAVPFTFQVLRSGHPILGCARPKCFGWNANGTRAADSVQFYRINEKEDGYLRRSDQVTKNPSKDPQYQPKTSICSERYTDSCRPDEWVGGLAPQEDPQSSPLKVRCCSYHMLEVSEDRGVATVKQGQLVVGGEYMEADKLLGFDYISNLQKSFYDNGTIYYSVTIKRMQCQDDESVFPEAELNLVQGGSKTTTTEPLSQDNAIVHYPIGRADEPQQISKTAPRQVQPSAIPSPTPATSNPIQSQPYSSTANTVVSQPTQVNYPQPQTSNIQPLPSHNPIAQGVTTVQGYPQIQLAANPSPYGQYYQSGYGIQSQALPQSQTGQIGLPSPFSLYQFQHPLAQPQATPSPLMGIFTPAQTLFPTLPPVTMAPMTMFSPIQPQVQPQIQTQVQPQAYGAPTYTQPAQSIPVAPAQVQTQVSAQIPAQVQAPYPYNQQQMAVPQNYAQLPPNSQPNQQQQYAQYAQYYNQNYQGAPTPFPQMATISLPKLEDLPKIDIPSVEDVENVIPPVQKAILTSVAKFFGVL